MRTYAPAAIALFGFLLAIPATAQDSGRASWRPSTGSFGINCALGENTTIRSNNVQCSNTISSATTATTATQAQSLNPSATVNANQLSGVIPTANLPAGGGSGGTTCTGGQKSITGRSATAGYAFNATPGNYFYGGAGTGSFSGSVPSLGTGQTATINVTGAADGWTVSASVSGSATATCNADGSYAWSAVSLSGCQANGSNGNYICGQVF
jgi:hypothetical protein